MIPTTSNAARDASVSARRNAPIHKVIQENLPSELLSNPKTPAEMRAYIFESQMKNDLDDPKSFFWRRVWDSNPRAQRANAFRVRPVMTASITLHIKLCLRNPEKILELILEPGFFCEKRNRRKAPISSLFQAFSRFYEIECSIRR